MQTKTFTLLVTITDDGISAAFNPKHLADAVKGALETGISGVVIDGKPDQHLCPVASAEVDVFHGDATHLMCVQMDQQATLRAARRLHANLRAA